MRTLAKSLCVRWPSVNARAGQILCVPTDTDAIIEAYSKADERAKILNYCEGSLISEKSNAKLKINKKRGVNNTDIEKVEEVA